MGKKTHHHKPVHWFVVPNCGLRFMTWEPSLLMLTSLTLTKLPCRPALFILIGWGGGQDRARRGQWVRQHRRSLSCGWTRGRSTVPATLRDPLIAFNKWKQKLVLNSSVFCLRGAGIKCGDWHFFFILKTLNWTLKFFSPCLSIPYGCQHIPLGCQGNFGGHDRGRWLQGCRAESHGSIRRGCMSTVSHGYRFVTLAGRNARDQENHPVLPAAAALWHHTCKFSHACLSAFPGFFI